MIMVRIVALTTDCTAECVRYQPRVVDLRVSASVPQDDTAERFMVSNIMLDAEAQDVQCPCLESRPCDNRLIPTQVDQPCSFSSLIPLSESEGIEDHQFTDSICPHGSCFGVPPRLDPRILSNAASLSSDNPKKSGRALNHPSGV